MRIIFLLCCALALSGCGKKPAPAGSSLPREKARLVATAAALLVRGEVFSVAPTGSMEPTLSGRSFVVAEQCAFEDLAIGDIIVFEPKAGSPCVVHRVTGNGRTQGDANSSPDVEPVTAANLRGRVVTIVYGRLTPDP